MGGCPLSCSALQASSNASPRISVTRSSKTVPAFRINGSIDPNPNSSHAKIRTPRLIRPDVSNIAHLKNSRSIVFRLIPAIWNREKPSIVPDAFAARALEEVNDFTSAGVEDDLWGPQPRFAARAFASIPRLGFREIVAVEMVHGPAPRCVSMRCSKSRSVPPGIFSVNAVLGWNEDRPCALGRRTRGIGKQVSGSMALSPGAGAVSFDPRGTMAFVPKI